MGLTGRCRHDQVWFTTPRLCHKIMLEYIWSLKQSRDPVRSENSSSLFAHLLICPLVGLRSAVTRENYVRNFAIFVSKFQAEKYQVEISLNKMLYYRETLKAKKMRN